MIKPKIILLQMLLASGALCHGDTTLVVSIPDQQLSVLENGVSVASYRVSTSRFGLGDSRGSYATPLGEMEIAQKIGAGAPLGAVFKGRHQTGEVIRPNSAGRDPIVTRILWLRGLEARNQHAYERGIYIHGTPVERFIGRPASYGCIRMRSRDIVQLFEKVSTGARIVIRNESAGRAVSEIAATRNHAKIAG